MIASMGMVIEERETSSKKIASAPFGGPDFRGVSFAGAFVIEISSF
jgi:hypothetical protein